MCLCFIRSGKPGDSKCLDYTIIMFSFHSLTHAEWKLFPTSTRDNTPGTWQINEMRDAHPRLFLHQYYIHTRSGADSRQNAPMCKFVMPVYYHININNIQKLNPRILRAGQAGHRLAGNRQRIAELWRGLGVSGVYLQQRPARGQLEREIILCAKFFIFPPLKRVPKL